MTSKSLFAKLWRPIAVVAVLFALVVGFQNCETSNSGGGGNVQSASVAAPVITSPTNAAIVNSLNSITISGTCADGTTVKLSGAASADVSTPAGQLDQACSGGSFSYVIDKSVDGTYTFQFIAEQNGVQSTLAAVQIWQRDTAAPNAPSLTAPATNPFYSSVNDSTLSIQGTCETNATVDISGDATASTACVGGAFLFTVNQATGSTNSFSFALKQTDLAGNFSGTTALQWVRQDIPQTPTVTTPAIALVRNNQNSLTIEGGCETGYTVYLDGAASQSVGCTSSAYQFTVNKSNDGDYTFNISQKNNANEASAAATVQWSRDTDAPAAPTIAAPGPSTYLTASSNITIAGLCETDATVSITPTGGSATTQVCTAGAYAFNESFPNDGPYEFTLQQTDVAGNASTTVLFQAYRDTAVPATPVISAPSQAMFSSSSDNLTISGTCTDNLNVILSGDADATQACSGSAFSFDISKSSASGSVNSYTFSIKQTSATGIDSGAATQNWNQDKEVPAVVTISSPANGTTESSGNSLIISGGCEDGAQVNLGGDDSASMTCASAAFEFTVSKTDDNTYNFTVTQSDAAGNTSGSVPVQWVRNSVAPPTPVVLSHGPVHYGTSTQIAVNGTCNAGNAVHMTGDLAAQNTTCDGTGHFDFTVQSASDGSFNLWFSQTRADLTSGTSGIQWILDRSAPNTTITDAPSTWISSTSAAVQFDSNEAGTFECKLDSGDYATCVSGWTVSDLAPGAHTVHVRAVDMAGNTDATPATATFNVDPTAPVITFTSFPVTPTNSDAASFQWTSDDANTTYQCKLTGSYSSCSGSKSYSNLNSGNYTFSVKATNPAGGVSTTTFSWTVDTSDPGTTINDKPASYIAVTTATVTFSSSSSDVVSFQCKLDSGSYSTCATGTSGSMTYNNLTAGSHTIYVRSVDHVGNIDSSPASTSFTVDTTAPVITLTMTPNNPTTSSSAMFGWTVDDSGCTFQCSLDGSSFSSCTSTKSYSNLSKSQHTFSVKATNQAGTTGDVKTYTWTRN